MKSPSSHVRGLRFGSLLLALLLTVLAWPAAAPAFAAYPSNPGSATADALTVQTTSPHVNVAIQVGHWQESQLPAPLARLRGDTGTSGGGRSEVSLNLDIAQRVAAILRARGLTVAVLPATVPTGFEADMFIALHADGNSSSVARGYKVSTRWNSEVAVLDATLVRSLDAAYGQVTGLPRDSSITRAMRGYYAYSTYRGEEYRLSGTTPGAIIEMGFMTNARDRALMFNQPDLIARGIVAGVTSFYAALPHAEQAQARVTQQAAATTSRRAVVSLYDGVNIRAGQSSSAHRVAVASFGETFPILGAAPTNRPPGSGGGSYNPRMGTTLASAAGWYNISVPGTGSAYISRDVVVVQQAQRGQ